MTLIIIFVSSLFIALALIAIKAVELRFGRVNIVLKLIGRLDSLAIKTIQSFKFRVHQITQTIRFIFQVKIKEVANDLRSRSREWILNEYRKRESKIMGQKEILNKGSVSFYLKKITHDRVSSNKGKIE